VKIRLIKEKKPRDSKLVSKGILHDGNNVLILSGIVGLGWDLPGGHIHIGEDPVAGLKREVYEETGLNVENPVETHFEGHTHYYKASLPPGKIHLSHEHTEYKLVDYKNVDNIDMTDKFKSAIKKSMEYS